MRPAAAKVRLRRPAAVNPPPAQGQKLGDLPLADLKSLDLIHLKGAIYYGRGVDVVGKVVDVRMDSGQLYVDLEIKGTQDDALLHLLSGRPDRKLAVHACEGGCANQLQDELLIHGKEFDKLGSLSLPWHSNLVDVKAVEPEVDELARLREEARLLREEKSRGVEEAPKKEKKKKKINKKAKKDKASDEGSTGGKEKKKKKKVDSSDEVLERGQKRLSVIFEGTGLDPDLSKRASISKKARRVVRNKKKKKKDEGSGSSSGSSGSSSSSTGEVDGTGLFDTEKRMHAVWKKYPGALACTAAGEARQHLVASTGAVWEVDKRKVNPVFTLYARQILSPVMNPGMSQEAITVAQCLDYLLQGHVAATCDILGQRLKSLESSARGGHWSVSRQLELCRADAVSIAEDEEARQAARRAREEDRLKALVSKSIAAKVPDFGSGQKQDFGSGYKGAKKGKDWKGNGKNKADDGRGKGNQEKGREDNKDKWQRKEKQWWHPEHQPSLEPFLWKICPKEKRKRQATSPHHRKEVTLNLGGTDFLTGFGRKKGRKKERKTLKK